MHVEEYDNFVIQRQTKGKIPKLPFFKIKNAILGKKYELSLLFPQKKLSQKLHKKWKNKNDTVNILSFPLDKKSGEIILTLEKARREAKNYKHSYKEHLIFLFIHGCLHLKGMDHGDKMEKEEEKFCKKYFKEL